MKLFFHESFRVFGDKITIDAEVNTISVDLSDDELSARHAAWQAPEPKYKRGVLAKFAKTACSASEGAVTDKF